MLICIFGFLGLKAQKIKTDVLVTGRENWAAALQSASSAVKTIFLYSPGNFPVGQLDVNLPSGIAAELLKKTKGTATTAQTDYIIEKWLDSTKNLSLIQVQEPFMLLSSGSGWKVRLADGRDLRAKVAVSSTPSLNQPLPIDYTAMEYRTSLGSGIYYSGKKTTATFFTLRDFLSPEKENAVYVPFTEIQAAQAAGAIAAYAAFFKTKTSLSNVKRIQGELLGFKMALVPLTDVSPSDSTWRAVQNLTLMGVLKPVVQDGNLFFKPRQPVQIEEVKQPLKDLFYKAQIWFDDNGAGTMTLAKTIALVCYVGNKSEDAVRMVLEKRWDIDFKLEGPLDYTKPISRTAFSILVNAYLKPADVGTDKSGRITR